ncbi:class 1 alpha-mannosidase 1a [Niveomyces insectorum RCEF 264]|uniref:alpha-1,2-Mannosidase n=1 Tax=Niveomyces insectorum RCEF 264 TaxID=1081102 RepID=A0A167X917_9HYPO|nr:class 1 alpha-mannosidase 1a [Niveomyces insectorum RCEF 264]
MLRFRRYRVFAFAAAVILFLLFRLSQNSQWNAQPRKIYRGYATPGTKQETESGNRSNGGGSDSAAAAAGAGGGSGGGAPPPADAGSAAPDPDAAIAKAMAKEAAAQAHSIHVPQLHTSLEVKGSYGLPTTHRLPASPKETPLSSPLSPGSGKAAGGSSSSSSNGNAGAGIGAADAVANPPPAFQETVAPVVDATAAAVVPIYSTSTIHWVKMPEYFPIPEESLILLPTGAPKPIPRIQHRFEDETAAAREVREKRLASVRGEMQHAWEGYRKYAYTHDELTPVSKSFRDPFCGWAASLVDGLDTLWIMAMHEEFDEAYEALKQIDFTTTPYRSEIPVFETIIRYLGGLIAAYDVTGGSAGNYPALLTKAVELAEILMGVFDTPNRMPILYYSWKPVFSSQPRHASTSVSVAELGSMSMEFTRLAQLTGHTKYYDAIARITDAFEEWQNRGTALPGIFPETVDASGCNRSLAALEQLAGASTAAKEQVAAAAAAAAVNQADPEPVGYKPPQPAADPMVSVDKVKLAKTMPPDLEFRVNPASKAGEPAVGEFHNVNKRDVGDSADDRDAEKRAAVPPPVALSTESTNTADAVADAAGDATGAVAPGTLSETTASSPAAAAANQKTPKQPADPPIRGAAGLLHNGPPTTPVSADGKPTEFQCVPMNLTSGGYGMDSYSMGGSQDSTYEYFPKEYLLLGGLVPKYQTMHEKVADAVKKYLLYRPMIKDESRDIRFSAKVSSRDRTDKDLIYHHEITHLTCFLGGMLAMGGRIFNRPDDVDIGGKLTDGCVWAYEVMPTGIMPEGSTIMPCDDPTSCPWNETLWHARLDPSASWRTQQLQRYREDVKEWEAKKMEVQQLQELRRETEERALRAAANAEAEKLLRPVNDSSGADVVSAPNVHKRDGPVDGRSLPPSGDTVADPDTAAIDRKVKALEHDLDLNSVSSSEIVGGAGAAGAGAGASAVSGAANNGASTKTSSSISGYDQLQNSLPQQPLVDTTIPPEPIRPETHEEFVQHRIERDRLPPGFIDLNDRRYILRPEAIESVWYMYRITGDPKWQDKGWRMFQAIIKATKTEVGHSAIGDVTADPDDEPNQLDNMESFWFAETLKYFYLLFAKPDIISLDEWVLNTEAHPFKRPT